ncbi:MAG: histidine--tRNA ligase [Parcubacteria bacterium C7867-003]|nr:MAG: histidine--tRNA ligase [Parcubacteria bacterium C7867-003]
MSDKSKISTESYKGVRDFYPEDLFIQNYIFEIWKKTVESFGYEEYNASILESSELYKAKSGEEIVNEQTYTFVDRGDREVTLRPEMTPTVARMVAGREQELTFPLRWYSIPNLFRYEKPQRGRLREHWQLNVDLFGVDSNLADIEIVNIAYKIMLGLGAKDEDFIIRINDRRIIKNLYEKFGLNEENSYKASKIIDKKDKISKGAFEEAFAEVVGEKSPEFIELLESHEKLLDFLGESEITKEMIETIEKLLSLGVKNVTFDPTLVRGFDYYTGMVFEVFDTDTENNRSVFGGGRYDDLMSIFGAKKVPSVGFGAGDVTAKDFLEKHNLLPVYKSQTKVYICTVEEGLKDHALDLAQKLREAGVSTAVDLTNKKLGDQIKVASKQKIPFVICIGEDEIKTGTYTLKNMETREEKKVKLEDLTRSL